MGIYILLLTLYCLTILCQRESYRRGIKNYLVASNRHKQSYQVRVGFIKFSSTKVWNTHDLWIPLELNATIPYQYFYAPSFWSRQILLTSIVFYLKINKIIDSSSSRHIYIYIYYTCTVNYNNIHMKSKYLKFTGGQISSPPLPWLIHSISSQLGN